ncbi:DNA repair nucleotidyl transferase/DNA polymerase [Haloferula helveola]|uniref:DNA repair nucleotidyl transferase/DNA polymerase n=1 Tax=Haloferula helveola TaxID=490095 RepID=A0ABN6HE57_9BACT|nr:DNA repair nucleotidyl transferase/DNA polymerase [Haloferula helveola]
MFLAFHLPALPLEALLRHHPEKRQHPCAVLAAHGSDRDKSTVDFLNRPAAAAGVHPGFSLVRTLARCPRIHFFDRDPDLEARALHDLLTLAESITPDFELTAPDTFLLDLSGAPDARDLENLKPRIPAFGLPIHLATAATPDLAHLFSLHPASSHVLVFRGPESRWKPPAASPETGLHPLQLLPLSLIQNLPRSEPGAARLELLHQWGLQSLADLARLPRQALAERLGPETGHLHDLLHGKTHRLLHLFRPAESISTHFHFEHPVDRCEPLLFIIRRALHTLCSRLLSRHHAASEIDLQLETQPPHRHRIRLPEPSASVEILIRPLATHLDHLQLPSPAEGLTLTLTPCAPHAGQHELFDRGIRHPHRLADTLTRLAALLGDRHVGFPVPAFTHKPDTFHLQPAHERLFGNIEHRTSNDQRRSIPRQSDSGSSTFAVERSTFDVPLVRFRPPIPIAVAWEKNGRHPHPLALLTGPHRGRIAKHHGPFPLSGDWWQPERHWQHLEWDIELESRHLLRLIHTPPDQWHLHGSYP